jgi:hypothetical protein
VKVGESITLDASGSSDPDGDQITHRWFHYEEVEGFRIPKKVTLADAGSSRVTVTVDEAKPGVRVHLILETKDDGSPPLYAYRRVILVVE